MFLFLTVETINGFSLQRYKWNIHEIISRCNSWIGIRFLSIVIDNCFSVSFKVSKSFAMRIYVTMVVDHSLKSILAILIYHYTSGTNLLFYSAILAIKKSMGTKLLKVLVVILIWRLICVSEVGIWDKSQYQLSFSQICPRPFNLFFFVAVGYFKIDVFGSRI